MFIGRKHDDGKLCVAEDRPTEVEKPVDCEFNARAHNPPEGTEVVVGCIGEKERVVRLQRRTG